MLFFFPRDVLDETLDLIESVSEDFLPILPTQTSSQDQFSSDFRFLAGSTRNIFSSCVFGGSVL